MKKAIIIAGAVVGGIIGLYGGAYLVFTLMGDGQAGFAGFYCGMPVMASLGALIGWLISKRIGKK
jgi:hypothetical protein